MAVAAGRSHARSKTSSLSNVMGSVRERNRLSASQFQRCKFDCEAHDYGARCACQMREHRTPCVSRCRTLARRRRPHIACGRLERKQACHTAPGADALLCGSLDEAMLEERPSPDAAEILCGIKGIGPWTATVILLRGLGRLDVFPMNDSSVARNLAFVAGAAAVDVDRVLTELGAQRGMLYYHLLLARLDARGEIGRASFA